MAAAKSRVITIDYTDHNRERSPRQIKPIKLWFGESEGHEKAQWFLNAEDIVKKEKFDFAMRNIHGWYDYV